MSDDGIFLQPGGSAWAVGFDERVRIVVPAGAGMPSEMTCRRCGLLAMPWLMLEDLSRAGSGTWACFVCGRVFEILEAGSEV